MFVNLITIGRINDEFDGFFSGYPQKKKSKIEAKKRNIV
jgi:hypothetical protein